MRIVALVGQDYYWRRNVDNFHPTCLSAMTMLLLGGNQKLGYCQGIEKTYILLLLVSYFNNGLGIPNCQPTMAEWLDQKLLFA
jgi:hypothetical protein